MAGVTALTTARAHVALCSVALVWAGAFAAIKHLLASGLTAPEVAAARYLVAAPGFAVALLLAGGLAGVSRRDLARIAIAGLLVVAVYHLALNAGERSTTSGTAAVIIGTAPGMALALAVALGLERFSRRRGIGLAVAFLGVVVVVVLGAGQSVGPDSIKGPLVVLIAPLSFVLFSLIAKPIVTRASAVAVGAAASLIGTAALLPLLDAATLDHVSALDGRDWLLVAYLGLVCTLYAYIAWTLALTRIDASQAVAYLYAVPPLAVVIGAVTLDEPVTVWLAAGMALVVGGIALAQVRP